MAQTLHNNVFTKLAASLSNSATSISLLDGSDFPTPAVGDFYFATLVSISASTGKEDDWEIVKVTGKPATNTLTVTRGQEGTAARAWDTYTPCEIRITAGTVIMPDGTQNLSNKTITSSTLDGSVIGGTTAAAGSFTDLDATTVEATNVEVTNIKANDGTAAGSIADSTGVVSLNSAVLTTADINGGTVDGATIGQTTAALGTFTDMVADELQLTGGSGDQGKLSWNSDENTVDLVVDTGEILQLGQEVEYNVRNNSGSSIAKGVPVMITGTIGSSGRITIDEMDATSVANDKKYLGITAEAIASGADGKVMYFGKVSGLNTSSYSDGDLLFLDTSVVGGLTATEPSSGIKLGAAYVIHSHASVGVLMVRPSASVGLHDLHDVFVDAPGTGEIIRYNATSGLWETKTLAEAGIATTTNFTSTGIDDNASSTVMTIASSGETTFTGDVTISEATPSITLDDADNADGELQIIQSSGSSFYRSRGASGNGVHVFQRNDGTTNLKVFQTNSIGDVVFYENDGVTSGLTWDASASKLTSFTSTGIDDNATSTAITIDSDENVGIGIAPSSTYGRLRVGDGNSDINMDGNAKGQFHIDGNAYAFGIALNTSGAQLYTNSATRDLIFGTDETERVRINGSGNLGIANNNPSERLSIIGTSGTAKIRFDGDSSNLQNNFIGITGYDDLIIASDEANSGTASTVQFRVDASERMRLNATGLSIGTGADATATLDVSGSLKLSGSHPVGTRNTALGQTAFNSAQSGASYNVAVGFQSMYNNTTGTHNVGIGYNALVLNTTGHSNSALGFSPLSANTTGLYNVAIGYEAMRDNTTANNNVAVGYQSSHRNTTGAQNVAVGRQAMYFNTTGTYNTALGDAALFSNTTASNNTAVGREALLSNTTGEQQVAIGAFALEDNTTGTRLTAVGYGALRSNTTANSSVAVGYAALSVNTTGSDNNALGRGALGSNTTGGDNNAFGYNALNDNTTGTKNTAMGHAALDNSTTASYCTAIGDVALTDLTTGSYMTALGRGALADATTSNNSLAAGNDAARLTTTGAFNHALGVAALYSNTTGQYNTAVGYASLYNNTVDSNLAVGHNACFTNVTGVQLTGVGYGALQNTTGSANTAVGYLAGYGNTSGFYNVAIGDYALYDSQTTTNHVAVGHYALFENTSGDSNTAVGSTALQNNTAGSYNTAVGRQAGQSNTTSSFNTFLGWAAGSANTTGAYNVAVGASSFLANTTANYSVAVGYQTLDANTTGARNCAAGYGAMTTNTTGSYNTAFGSYALNSQTTPTFNVAVGYQAGYTTTTGGDNTFVGTYAGYTNSGGTRNVALGYYAGGLLNASYNTVLGYNAGSNITSGAGNTVIGYASATSGSTNNYSIVIGYALSGQGSSTVTLGSSSGSIYNSYTANATWQTASDGRYKKEIADNTDCGLGFINDLRSVTYKWKAKSEIDPSLPDYDAEEAEADFTGRMYGLVAQEVKAALDKHGITDFAGWDEDIEGKQQISREMFVIPLIKAVQELSAKVTALENGA